MPGGFLLVLSLVAPLAGVLLAFVAGGRRVEAIALSVMPVGLAIAAGIAVAKSQTDGPLVYLLGGWAPPLGLALRADSLSAIMTSITAIVICAIGVFARADFRTPARSGEVRAPFAFWLLLLAIWGALNMVFVGGDLFTLYVALELLTFSAVPLVSLDGRPETLQAALRYLLFALLGSILYLAGTVLLYGSYGTLDIVLLAGWVRGDLPTLVAAALMTVGLLAKTALFPLHLWLPPAHAGAPAAASAVLSGLVVKGSFFLVVRLWFDLMPGLTGYASAQVLGAAGAAAILFGSVVALRQDRLKLLVAYSTVAQIGYLFLMFPLAFGSAAATLQGGDVLIGGILQASSHATAKASMFMAAGLIYAALGHDRIGGLTGLGRALPMSVLTFTLAGVALIGVPPSGASLAKTLFLQAAAETEQWWWAFVVHAGGVSTSSYVVLVLAHALAPARSTKESQAHVSRAAEAAALALALCSLLLGLLPWEAYSDRHGTSAAPSALGSVADVVWTVLAGGILAILLGRWKLGSPPARRLKVTVALVERIRRATFAIGAMLERVDQMARQWTAAGLSLLVLAILIATAMLAAQ
jgi:formate hydrogenlyase subunit 3/multisubunit Na+/H+ antiporter MnhD subunit